MTDFSWLDEVIAGAMARAKLKFPLDNHRAALTEFGIEDASNFWGEIAWAADGASRANTIDRTSKTPAPSRFAVQLRAMAAQLDSALSVLAQLDEMEAVAIALADAARLKTLCQVQETLMASLLGNVSGSESEWAGDYRIRIAEWQADTHALSDGLNFAADLVVARSEGTRGSGSSQRYLRSFIPTLAGIWERMTSRPATAERIERKHGHSLPDFVLFVQYVARMAGVPEPTASMVKTGITQRKAALAATG